MPGFSDISADMTRVCFAQLGDPATFETADGVVINDFNAELEERTAVVGDLGHLIDQRPSIKLPRAAIGSPKRGTVRMLGRVFELDSAVDGSGDGEVAHYFVREIPNG